MDRNKTDVFSTAETGRANMQFSNKINSKKGTITFSSTIISKLNRSGKLVIQILSPSSMLMQIKILLIKRLYKKYIEITKKRLQAKILVSGCRRDFGTKVDEFFKSLSLILFVKQQKVADGGLLPPINCTPKRKFEERYDEISNITLLDQFFQNLP